MADTTPEFDPLIAHIITADGDIYQVIAPDGHDWDQAATEATITADDPVVDGSPT